MAPKRPSALQGQDPSQPEENQGSPNSDDSDQSGQHPTGPRQTGPPAAGSPPPGPPGPPKKRSSLPPELEPISHHVGRFVQKATVQEAKDYDFTSMRGPQITTNLFESIAHLVKGCLGAGLVSIHESYMVCGLLSSLVLNIILGIFVSYCMFILLKSAQKMYGRIQEPKLSYPDLAEAALAIGPFPKLKRFDRCFRYAVDSTIMIDLFGSCCVYMVLIARAVKQLYENSDIISDEGIRLYILYLLIPCILITWILQLKYLAPFSIVANAFIITTVGATIYYGFTTASRSVFDFPVLRSFGGLFEFMGGCVFAMEGVGVSMAIENTMTEPKKFPVVIFGGMSVVVSMVCLVGFFGYWGFGDQSLSPVTLNFPLSTLTVILKVMMALVIYVTFALNFWVPFDLAWYYIKRKHNPAKYWLWERVYRSLFVIVITVIALIFPNVSSFIGLLGSFCLSNMGFIYPAFIELCLDWEDPGLGFMKWRLVKFIAILIFGCVICIVGTYSSVKNLLNTLFK